MVDYDEKIQQLEERLRPLNVRKYRLDIRRRSIESQRSPEKMIGGYLVYKAINDRLGCTDLILR